MSTFSQYGMGSTFSDDIDFVANESYDETVGVYQAATEAVEAEHQLFEQVIGRDFLEANCEAGFISESALESINESSISGVWEKVKQFFKDLGEKIMGIVKRFRDKIVSVFIRDGKELVKKYKKDVYKQFNTGKLAKMKFKYCKPKAAIIQPAENSTIGAALQATLEDGTKQGTIAQCMNKNLDKAKGDAEISDDEVKPYTAEKKESIIEETYKVIVPNCDPQTFKKDLMELYFEDEEEMEGVTQEILTHVIDVLESSKKTLDDLTKFEKKSKKAISELVKSAERVQKSLQSQLKSTEPGDAAKKNAYASRVINLGTSAQTVIANVFSAYSAAVKKDMSQSRAIFRKCITANPSKKSLEEAALFEAYDEISAWEVSMMFD